MCLLPSMYVHHLTRSGGKCHNFGIRIPDGFDQYTSLYLQSCNCTRLGCCHSVYRACIVLFHGPRRLVCGKIAFVGHRRHKRYTLLDRLATPRRGVHIQQTQCGSRNQTKHCIVPIPASDLPTQDGRCIQCRCNPVQLSRCRHSCRSMRPCACCRMRYRSRLQGS